MKIYTFKIKSYSFEEFTSENGSISSYNPVVVSVTCPLEVLYDSIKATSELSNFNGFITQTDYLDTFTDENENEVSNYIRDDIFVGDVLAVFKSKDLKDFLINNFYVEDDDNEKGN